MQSDNELYKILPAGTNVDIVGIRNGFGIIERYVYCQPDCVPATIRGYVIRSGPNHSFEIYMACLMWSNHLSWRLSESL